MDAEGRFVLWFDEPGATQLSLVGGKGANLARLVAAGFVVPRGFCVTTEAYGDFVGHQGLQDRILATMADATERGAVAERAGAIRDMVAAQPVPGAIAEATLAAYDRLGPAVPVAVRSSATAEDLPDASFAGQQDTYLNVVGPDALLDAVKRCWASLWSDRAASYRIASGYAHETVRIAVVVQAMVQPTVAGVLFTANPLNGRRNEAVINASYGLGEAVVSGRVTPDTFTVVVGREKITARHIATKEIEIVSWPGGTVVERRVAADRAATPSLEDEQVLALARLGARVADHYGAPQDIEWALVDDEFQLLQCRPITSLPERAEADPADHWTRAMFTEILPEAPSPAFCSVLEPILGRMLTHTFQRLGQRAPSDVPPIGVFYHQPYLNLRFIDGALAALPEASRARLRGRIANPFSHAPDQLPRGRPAPADLKLAVRMLREARRLPREISLVVDDYYAALAHYPSIDLAARDDEQLVADLRVVAVDLLTPLVETDFLLIGVLGFAHRVLERAVARAGVGDPLAVRGQLMSGVTGNVTMETNKALWRLAESARRHPAVAAAITDGPEDEIPDRIAPLPGGPEFLEDLSAFLAVHGHREAHMDVITPTWGEDPTPVYRFVRAYLTSPEAVDPADLERASAARRKEAETSVRTGLSRSAKGRLLGRPLFDMALRYADALAAQRDTMHYHWTAAFPVIRAMIHEIGTRLAATGCIDDPEDAYQLELDDLELLLRHPSPARELVARRRRAWEADRLGPWPVEIRYGEEVFEEPVAPAPEEGRARHGVPGSPGTARGRVRVVRGPADFDALREGDVLVAPLTNPVWTPLFAVAAAVVTDAGGILSHGAIVAREYGIPAVMGVGDATAILRDGEIVTVDGNRGTVVPDEP